MQHLTAAAIPSQDEFAQLFSDVADIKRRLAGQPLFFSSPGHRSDVPELNESEQPHLLVDPFIPAEDSRSAKQAYNTWKQVKAAITINARLSGLAKDTLRHYWSFFNELSRQGFKPRDLSSQSSLQKVMEYITTTKPAGIANRCAAIKKVLRVCFPGAPVSVPRVKKPATRKKWPTIKEVIDAINEMSEHDLELAMNCLFLLVTGTRIGEAKRLSIDDFDNDLAIVDMPQEKSKKPRPFVFISKQFKEFAKATGWKRIQYDSSWLNKKLKGYKLSCHAFRHGFVTITTQEREAALRGTSRAIGHSSPRITATYFQETKGEEMMLHERALTLRLEKMAKQVRKESKRRENLERCKPKAEGEQQPKACDEHL